MQDRLHDAKYFTIIDIKDSCHWIRITEGSIEKTAFCTQFQHVEYVVLPFGLTNAPKLLVKEVLDWWVKHKLCLKRLKCEWAKPELEVEFCGYMIGRDGMKISPRKIESPEGLARTKESQGRPIFLGAHELSAGLRWKLCRYCFTFVGITIRKEAMDLARKCRKKGIPRNQKRPSKIY